MTLTGAMTETLAAGPAPTDPASTGRMPRPLFHLTPRRHWMNDPNGLVHHGGLWHVYFQYNPDGSDWGHMSWGHATSPDLLHWTEHPVALRHRVGEQVFSGSVVASRVRGDDTLTALYTSAYDDAHQAQSRATSTDGGYTWQRDPGNPVLDRGTSTFRDPKVVRYLDTDGHARWLLVAVEAEDRQVLLYTSADLREWTYQSAFGPVGDDGLVWECPDLVRLPVDGDPENQRWVLLLSTNPVGEDADPDGSSMSYAVGTFDGHVFTPDAEQLTRLDHGRDLYAGVTFDDAPGGQAVMLGWMSNWRYAASVPTAPWRGAMSLPRRLALRTLAGRVHLVQEPFGFVRSWLDRATPATVPGHAQPVELVSSGHLLCELRWDPAETGSLRLGLRGAADALVSVCHDVEAGELQVTRSGPDAEAVHPDFPGVCAVELGRAEPVHLLLSLDGPLLEVFVNQGEQTLSSLVPLGTGPVTLTLDTDDRGPVTLTVVDPAAELTA